MKVTNKYGKTYTYTFDKVCGKCNKPFVAKRLRVKKCTECIEKSRQK